MLLMTLLLEKLLVSCYQGCYDKFRFVADKPYNQIMKHRVNCMMQLALFFRKET